MFYFDTRIGTQKNGEIHCRGCYLDNGARAISRVARSSLGAETVSIANICDLAIWARALVLEVITGASHRGLIVASRPYTPITPFVMPPIVEELSSELRSSNVDVVHNRETSEDMVKTARSTLEESLRGDNKIAEFGKLGQNPNSN